jgi:hypothetical protein
LDLLIKKIGRSLNLKSIFLRNSIRFPKGKDLISKLIKRTRFSANNVSQMSNPIREGDIFESGQTQKSIFKKNANSTSYFKGYRVVKKPQTNLQSTNSQQRYY